MGQRQATDEQKKADTRPCRETFTQTCNSFQYYLKSTFKYKV